MINTIQSRIFKQMKEINKKNLENKQKFIYENYSEEKVDQKKPSRYDQD